MVLSDGLIVGAPDGELSAYSRETGHVLWRTNAGAVLSTPVHAGDGRLIAQKAALVVIDANDGSELARRRFPSGGLRAAMVTSGRTYLAVVDGVLLALR